jgi:hypothetical protein
MLKYPEKKLRFTREGWNGEGMWICLQCPDENSKMTQPYIYIQTSSGNLVPWLASQSDMLAQDWIQLPENYDKIKEDDE